MARDYEDIDDLDDLSDDELRGLVRDRLAAHNALDIDDLTVRVENGRVLLAGRVGTDGERLIAEHILTDTLGITDYQNDIFVDQTRRALSPEAIDEHLADEDRREGLLLGDRAVPMEAENDEVADDLDSELYGTTDVRKAIEEGTAWIPPESATQEGFVEDRGETGEAH
ncbi:MAG TPA: BON domain-containing protein [Gemmatimonadaceae bacterium]|jgi:hypothetical protein